MATHTFRVIPLVFAALLYLRAPSPASAAEASLLEGFWPQFRGPNASGQAVGQKLPPNASLETHTLWTTEIGSGSSSPVIAEGKAFLTAFNDGILEVIAVELSSGTVAWRHRAPATEIEKYWQKLGSPAASSCATDGKMVVSYFGSYGLLCHSLDGTLRWSLPMPLPQTADGFGTGSSPVLHNGIIYLLRDEDGPGKGLYAIDAATGKTIWHRKRDGYRVSFGSAVLWGDSVVVIGDTRVSAYDAKDGADRWVVRGVAAYPCTTPTVGSDGNLYVATWSPSSQNGQNEMPDFSAMLEKLDTNKDGAISFAEAKDSWFADFHAMNDTDKNGLIEAPEWEARIAFMRRGRNAVMAIRPGGVGDITETHVAWTREKGAPYVPNPVVVGNKLFTIRDGGLASYYNAANGEPQFETARVGYSGEYMSSPITDGTRVYVGNVKGEFLTIRLEEKPVVENVLKFEGPIIATPAFTGNRLYVRAGTKLVAVGEKGR